LELVAAIGFRIVEAAEIHDGGTVGVRELHEEDGEE
jgi:hypothetical protein